MFGDYISYDYMMGFLMGKALNSKKSQNKLTDYHIEMSEEEIKIGDDLILREMNDEILRRFKQRQNLSMTAL